MDRYDWFLVLGWVLALALLMLVCMDFSSAADCPGSSGMVNVKYGSGVIVSRWMDIDNTTCLGICPGDVRRIENAWSPIRVSGYWEYRNSSWYKRELEFTQSVVDNTPVTFIAVVWRSAEAVLGNESTISHPENMSLSTTNLDKFPAWAFELSMAAVNIMIG